MSSEILAQGMVESKKQLQKNSVQNIEHSSNASNFQSLDFEKSLKTREFFSTNIVSTTLKTSSTVMQSVEMGSSLSSIEMNKVEYN